MNDLNVGQRIRDLRFKYGIKQGELADKVGITRMTLSNYEKNTRQASIEIINKMAEVFNITLTEFLQPEFFHKYKKLEKFYENNFKDYDLNDFEKQDNTEAIETICKEFMKKAEGHTIKFSLKNMLEYLELKSLYDNENDIEDLEKNVINTIKYESYKKINNL